MSHSVPVPIPRVDNDEMADRFLRLAQDINPDNPTVKRLLG